MTLDELKAAYLGCSDAVEIHEDPRWQDLLAPMFEAIRASGLPLTEIRDQLYFNAQLASRIAPGGPLSDPKVREQMRHPDFLRYLRAKLDAV